MRTSRAGLLVPALGAVVLLVSLLARAANPADGAPASPLSSRATVVRAAPALEPPRSLTRVFLPPVTPEESDRAMRNHAVPAGLNPHLAIQARPGTKALEPPVPASIPELARALRNDVDLIYEYVRNNVEYYPIWGVQKGAVGTLLDGRGTAFDQAALMVALLRQAGYTASFVKGRIALNAAEIGAWLGVSTANACGVQSVLAAGRIPVAQLTSTGGGCTALSTAQLDHLWVKVTIGGSDYHFDPGYKPHALKAGIGLPSASGYNAAAYLSSAMTGATMTPDSIQNVNRANVRANLATLAGTLATHVRANLPAGELADLIGGQRIVPHDGSALRQASLPYRNASVPLTEFSDIPASFKPTLRVQHGDIDSTFTSDVLHGARLTIAYDATNHAVLALDGITVATSTTTFAPGSTPTIVFTIAHPAYATPLADQPFTQSVTAGGTYLIANGWGLAARGTIEFHRQRVEAAKAAGMSATSDVVAGSSLAVLGATWLAQMGRMLEIADRLGGTVTTTHHLVGIAGHDRASYVDLPGTAVSIVSPAVDLAAEDTVFFNQAMHGSVLESASVQQSSGISALSTVKLIDQAVAAGLKIYDARQSNYVTVVQPDLVACGAFQPTFQAAVDANARLLLPAHCDLNENAWTGAGYFVISADATSVGAAINGTLAGGLPSIEQALADYVNSIVSGAKGPVPLKQSTGLSWPEPIDMTHGHYLYERDDLMSGAGPMPFGLSFRRLYSSGLRATAGPLGNGWTHSYAMRVGVGSDGFQALGEDSALDAVGAIAEMMVAHDLLTDAGRPLDKLVIATVGQRWFGDQLLDNTVVVRSGLNGEVFVKLADGSYNAPPGNSGKLIKNGDGTYSLEAASRSRFDFSLAGPVAKHVDPGGVQVEFTYTGNDLTQVRNSLGRTLDLTYASGRIASVADGVRAVAYAYDGNGDLSAFTDATGAVTTFLYDQPGRLWQIFYPSNPSTAFVTNTYDTLGRVQTQANGRGKVWTYFFAGTRTEELAPDGGSSVAYLNTLGGVPKSIDALGRVVQRTYDAQGRLTRTVFPEGNGIEYDYDDATCLAQLRCTNSVKALRRIAKPASGLATLTSSFTYESAFNRVASATDPRGKTTDFTYTARGESLQVLAPAAPGGTRPQADYAYTTFTPAGFPSFVLPSKTTLLIAPGESVDEVITYDALNRYVPATRVVDAGAGRLNLTTTYTYDAFGNLTQVDGPRADVTDVTAFAYDAERRITQITDALGRQTRRFHDADGRPVRAARQMGGQWLVTCRTWSTSGRVLSAWGPALTAADTVCPNTSAPVPVTGYEYDDVERPLRVTQNLPAADGGNRVAEMIYRLDGSIQSVRRAAGTALAQLETTFTYTPNARPASITDARSNRTSYAYDGHDRLLRMSFPDKTVANTSSGADFEQYSYDENGNVTAVRRRNSQSIGYAYDNLNRTIGRTYPSAADNVTLGFDLLGRQLSANFADSSFDLSFAWDRAGRLLSSTAGGKTLAYQYDAAGNRVRTTWPDGAALFVTVDYDALSRPTAVRELGTTLLATYGYDDLSRRTTIARGNGTTTAYGYDGPGSLANLAHDLAGTANDVTLDYMRNQRQEIKGIAPSNPLYEWAGAAGGNIAYSANGLNQYTSVGGVPASYDANGNLAANGAWGYTYDAENKLRAANGNGIAATLAWDAAGRLRQTAIDGTTTRLLYDGGRLAAEYDGAGQLLRRYVHGPWIDEPLARYEGNGLSDKRWFYADHLGSIVATADAGGNATSTHNYGPFGEAGAGAPGRFAFTGQQFIAPLGIYYYRSRFYSPELGRFLQTDPIGYGGGMNLYNYVGENPVNATDPAGMRAHVSVDGNKVTITIPIIYAGAPNEFARDVATAAIETQWTTSTEKYDVTTKVVRGDKYDPNTNTVYLIPGNGRSKVRRGGDSSKQDVGLWYIEGGAGHTGMGAWDAMHEAGHLMGLEDHYTDHPDGKTTPHEGYAHHVMGAYGQTDIREEDIEAIIAANPSFGNLVGRQIGSWLDAIAPRPGAVVRTVSAIARRIGWK